MGCGVLGKGGGIRSSGRYETGIVSGGRLGREFGMPQFSFAGGRVIRAAVLAVDLQSGRAAARGVVARLPSDVASVASVWDSSGEGGTGDGSRGERSGWAFSGG